MVPRNCLIKAPVKPHPINGPSPNQPPIRGPPPGAIPHSLTPGGARNSTVPGVQVSHPLTPTGQNSSASYARSLHPTSPAGPAGRARANINASPYIAYAPQGRSMSPGPYDARRSNSVSQLSDTSTGAVPVPFQTVARKPVGGHKPSSSS